MRPGPMATARKLTALPGERKGGHQAAVDNNSQLCRGESCCLDCNRSAGERFLYLKFPVSPLPPSPNSPLENRYPHRRKKWPALFYRGELQMHQE